VHAKGYVHRDVKPSNVFLAETSLGQTVKLLDFGTARRLQIRDAHNDPVVEKTLVGFGKQTIHTLPGIVFGTPWYMSPEQAVGLPLGARSDQYALAVLVYEMLTGTLPFDDTLPSRVMAKHIAEEPEPLRARAPDADIPAELESAVLRALSKHADARFPTIGDFAAALFKAVEPPTHSLPPEPQQPAQAGSPVMLQQPHSEAGVVQFARAGRSFSRGASLVLCVTLAVLLPLALLVTGGLFGYRWLRNTVNAEVMAETAVPQATVPATPVAAAIARNPVTPSENHARSNREPPNMQSSTHLDSHADAPIAAEHSRTAPVVLPVFEVPEPPASQTREPLAPETPKRAAASEEKTAAARPSSDRHSDSQPSDYRLRELQPLDGDDTSR
jgi:serine/threonine-protein kinase